MPTNAEESSSGTTSSAATRSSSQAGLERPRRGRKIGRRWHPSVRLLLALVVLAPALATAVLIRSSATSAWNDRREAQVVATDASQLEVVASARAEMNALEVPLSAVSYAAQIGVNEQLLDSVLHPAIPFQVQLAQTTSAIGAYPTFSSTPILRSDVTELRTIIPKVAAGTISFTDVHGFLTKMAADVDSVWYRAYDHLQANIATWRPPGTFEVHAAALRQTYAAFLAGGHEIEGGIFVLEGIGPANAKQELIQSAGEFQTATNEFVGNLGTQGNAAWHHIQSNGVDRHFAGTIQQGLTVALNGAAPPFAGNVVFAGSSMAPGLHYLADLNLLVVAASTDLRNAALAQSMAASHRFTGEIVFLALLAFICALGVLGASRVLTRPLNRLARAAREVHGGHFTVDPLPEEGPAELVTAVAAFNDMTSTLQAVELKAVALAAEDLSHPELLTPLPGRTGHALQASVDLLSTRIRERELQRQLLHETATHDELTGLFNRAAVLDFLSNDVRRRRESGETVAVLFVDLDRLKPLNDNFGHEVGDNAILTTAKVLVRATEPCDIVGRLGGDEFLVILCHEHSADVGAVVQRIRRGMSKSRLLVGDSTVTLEASIGVALSRCDPRTDPMVLVRQADEAMYEAKRTSRAIRELNNIGSGSAY